MPARPGTVLVVVVALTLSILSRVNVPATQDHSPPPADPEERYDTARDAYFDGDYARAVPALRELAEEGYAPAQAALGDIYLNGQGVPRDPKAGAEWYRKAADQGFAPAQLNLGVCYERGAGVPEDLEEAVRWYRWAARNGSARAQRFLADMLASGKGVSKDWKEAEQWFGQAAANGEPQAETLMKVPEGKRQAVFERSRKPARTEDLMMDATRVIDLDERIFLVKFSKKSGAGLQLGDEKVTPENVDAILARLEGERAELLYGIQRVDPASVEGDYALTEPPEKKCPSLPDGALAYPVAVRVIQSEHSVELRGQGLAGCGYLVGRVLVLRAQRCEGTAGGTGFLAVAKEDGSIDDLTYFQGRKAGSCKVGTLRRQD